MSPLIAVDRVYFCPSLPSRLGNRGALRRISANPQAAKGHQTAIPPESAHAGDINPQRIFHAPVSDVSVICDARPGWQRARTAEVIGDADRRQIFLAPRRRTANIELP